MITLQWFFDNITVAVGSKLVGAGNGTGIPNHPSGHSPQGIPEAGPETRGGGPYNIREARCPTARALTAILYCVEPTVFYKTSIVSLIILGSLLTQEEAHGPHDHHELPEYINLYHSNDLSDVGYSGAIFKTGSNYITTGEFKDFLKIHWAGHDSWQCIEEGILDGSINAALPVVLKHEEFCLIKYLIMLYPNAIIEPINALNYNKRFALKG
jgi:hypothetical protein